jgi:tetratricopeptide (TPR) repeat protein
MKPPKFARTTLVKTAPTVEQRIAREFARIGELNRAGRHDEAWTAANNLYGTYPKEATPNFVIALILDENKQKADALQYAEAAVKFAPNSVRNLVFLGKLYVDLGMIEYAPTVLHKAFELDKTAFQAPWALGKYYLESGQGRRALPYFELALNAAPLGTRSEITMDRANCLRDIGQVDLAEMAYKPLFDQPGHRVNALTGAALLRKNDQNSAYAQQVRVTLATGELTSRDRSNLFMCLGRLYENGRDFETAFLNFEKAAKALTSKFDMKEFAASVDDRIRVLTRDAFERFTSYGHESPKPIFIVGMPRSGTTLTEQIIASHSLAEGVGELDRMSRIAQSFSSRGGMRQVLDTMAEAGPVQWKNAGGPYLNLVNAMAPEARHTVDKMPHNFMAVGFIHLCFPNAKIIHCKRNPLDTFISSYQNPMTLQHGYCFDQSAYGEYYVKYLQLMDYWKSVLPDTIHESTYEDLTANPEVEVRRMIEFLGLPWEDACLKFNERESTVQTFSRLQVRQPINTASVARWRKYETHLAPIMAVLETAGVKF